MLLDCRETNSVHGHASPTRYALTPLAQVHPKLQALADAVSLNHAPDAGDDSREHGCRRSLQSEVRQRV